MKDSTEQVEVSSNKIKETNKIQEYIGQMVIVDTSTSYIFIGELQAWKSDHMVLTKVDVHDSTQGQSTKERYILDSRRYALKTNREETIVLKQNVVSISRLEDVISF